MFRTARRGSAAQTVMKDALGHPLDQLSDMTLTGGYQPVWEGGRSDLRRALASTESSRLLGVVSAVVVIATLYFARVVFIPLALALLFSLLLAPPVAFLERIKLPRILAIFLVVVILGGLMGLIGWKTSQQFVDLTDQLPSYRKTLQDKIQVLKGSSNQSFSKATATVKELENEINTAAPGTSSTDETTKTHVAPGSSPSRPLSVEVVPPLN